MLNYFQKVKEQLKQSQKDSPSSALMSPWFELSKMWRQALTGSSGRLMTQQPSSWLVDFLPVIIGCGMIYGARTECKCFLMIESHDVRAQRDDEQTRLIRGCCFFLSTGRLSITWINQQQRKQENVLSFFLKEISVLLFVFFFSCPLKGEAWLFFSKQKKKKVLSF